MNSQTIELFEELSKDITLAYESGVTLDQAERLASKFLSAQLSIAKLLETADLDARMKKSGTKAVKAAVYMQEATKTDKKPSDVMLAAKVDMDELVLGEQKSLDEAEVYHDSLERYYSIFKEAHIFFRGVAKGNFNG